MTRARIIAKNAGILLFSQIISFIFGFLFIVYTARYLGVEGYGTLSFALAFTLILSVLSDMGLSVLTTRDVSRDISLAKKYSGNIIIMKIILGLFTLGVTIVAINLLNYPQQTVNLVYLITVYVIISSYSGLFYAIFQAYEKMEYQSMGQIINSSLMLLGAFILILNGSNIINFGFLYITVSLVVLAYSISVCAWKFFLPKVEVDWSFWSPTLKEAWPLSVAVIFSVIYFKVDTVLLSLLKGNMVVGWYVASYNILEFLLFIPAIFTMALYPLFSQLHESSPQSLQSSYAQSFKYLIILGLPISVGITFMADKIILLIYGSPFLPAAIALKILIWTIPLIFLTYMLRFLLISTNKQILVLKIISICMVFNIILNLLLIPKYSYLATSIVTVLTELLLLIFCIHYASKLVGKIKIQFIVKPMLASAVMGLFLSYFNENLIMTIIISAIIYLTVLILLKTFSKDEYDLFKKIIYNKQN